MYLNTQSDHWIATLIDITPNKKVIGTFYAIVKSAYLISFKLNYYKAITLLERYTAFYNIYMKNCELVEISYTNDYIRSNNNKNGQIIYKQIDISLFKIISLIFLLYNSYKNT